MTPEPTVLLHWAADGSFHHGATDDVRVICVDERAPDDRIYDTVGGVTHEWINAVVAGADPVDAARGYLR